MINFELRLLHNIEDFNVIVSLGLNVKPTKTSYSMAARHPITLESFKIQLVRLDFFIFQPTFDQKVISNRESLYKFFFSNIMRVKNAMYFYYQKYLFRSQTQRYNPNL